MDRPGPDDWRNASTSNSRRGFVPGERACAFMTAIRPFPDEKSLSHDSAAPLDPAPRRLTNCAMLDTTKRRRERVVLARSLSTQRRSGSVGAADAGGREHP